MKILVPAAHGSESLETVAIVNVLRRADFDVKVASIENDLTIAATRGIRIVADCFFADIEAEPFDLIALPGGEAGARALSAYASLIKKLKTHDQAGRMLAAICASPALVLAPHGFLERRRATCYPSFREHLPHYVEEPVVVDRNCITGSGPATAITFALKLVELAAGMETAKKVARGMLAA
jgi:4-methyl-5(b-hydroxyethyl)-thiazole monophosphate biosynthesis